MSEKYKIKLKDEKSKNYKVKVKVDYEIEVKGFNKEQALRDAKLIFSIGEKDSRVKEISSNWNTPEEVKPEVKFYYKEVKGIISIFDENMDLVVKCSSIKEAKDLGYDLEDPRYIKLGGK